MVIARVDPVIIIVLQFVNDNIFQMVHIVYAWNKLIFCWLFTVDIPHHLWWSLHNSSDGSFLSLLWTNLQRRIFQVFANLWDQVALKLLVSSPAVSELVTVGKCWRVLPCFFLLMNVYISGISQKLVCLSKKHVADMLSGSFILAQTSTIYRRRCVPFKISEMHSL